MNSAERLAYQKELRRVARGLGLPLRGDLEEAIIAHCMREVDRWVAAHGQPGTLTELLELVATSLGIEFEEIRDLQDLKNLLSRIPPSREPIMARIPQELDDETDAVTVRRNAREAWERPFLALINCQGRHFFRRFFTKWHEATHRLLGGRQLQLAFRHTPVIELRREPEEMLVDKVAAALAFYPSIFDPVFRQVFENAGRLSFAVIDETRNRVAPEASRHATLLACLRHTPEPVWFVRCNLRYKRGEQRQLAQGRLPRLVDRPRPKLRVKEASGSPPALDLEARVHWNMQVPDSSLVACAFRDSEGLGHSGSEPLEIWQTSSGGPIGYGTVDVEAMTVDEEVWALLRLHPDVRQPRGHRASFESVRSAAKGTQRRQMRREGGKPGAKRTPVGRPKRIVRSRAV